MGRDAVLEQRQQAADWRFIRLTVENSDADPISGDPIIIDGDCVGYVTSGGSGFRTGKCLALGYTEANAAIESGDIEVTILGENCKAALVQKAFYDPDNSRLRS